MCVCTFTKLFSVKNIEWLMLYDHADLPHSYYMSGIQLYESQFLEYDLLVEFYVVFRCHSKYLCAYILAFLCNYT